MVHGETYIIHLHNILFALKIACNLVSLSQAQKKRFKITIDTDKDIHQTDQTELVRKSSNKVKLIGNEISEGMYEAHVTVVVGNAAIKEEIKKVKWHDRLGHCNGETIRSSLPHFDGVKQKDMNYLDDEFHPCAVGNSTHKRRNLHESDEKAKKPVERVYTDVVRTMKWQSIVNANYLVTLFDEYSGFSMVRFMRRKSETYEAVKGMILQLESLFNKKDEKISCIDRKSRKRIRSDKGVNTMAMNSGKGKEVRHYS